MKEYLNMSDIFGDIAVKVRDSNGRHVMCEDILAANCFCTDSATHIAHAINSHDELVAEVERLRQALIDAATSLETIHVRSYGEDSFLDSKHEMRIYAGSRAKVARAALAEQ